MTIDISKKEKVAVLKALYDAAPPKGLGIYAYKATPLSIKGAEHLLSQTKMFDYLDGRTLKVDLRGDTLDTTCYDEANGVGSAKAAIDLVPDII